MSADAMECSFCGLPEARVGPLNAGPDAFVCQWCLALCRDIFTGYKGSVASDLVCSFCGLDHRHVVVAGPKVFICDECVGRFSPEPS